MNSLGGDDLNDEYLLNSEMNIGLSDYVNKLKDDSENLLQISKNTNNLSELLKIQKNHKRLCENIVEQKNDVINGDIEYNVKYLDNLHEICLLANKTLNEKILENINNKDTKIQSLNKIVNTTNRKNKIKTMNEEDIKMQKRVLALSQEKNIYSHLNYNMIKI